MAERPALAYPGQSNAISTSYPDGSARNDVAADDRLGTPWIANLINDIWGFHQALLIAGGVTPNGSPDTATNSDKLTALQALISGSSGSKTGDVIESSDTPANLIARGFLELKEGVRFVPNASYPSLRTTIGLGFGDVGSTFGLPPAKPRLRPNYAHPGSWALEAVAVPPGGDASPQGIAFNPVNGDQWYIDSNLFERLYRKTNGTGSWVSVDVSGLGLNNVVAIALDWKREEVWLVDASTNELHQINYNGSLIKTYTNVQGTDVDIHIETGTVFITIDSGPKLGLFRLNRRHSIARDLEPVGSWPTVTPSAIPTKLAVDQDSGDVTVFSARGEVARVFHGSVQDENPRYYDVGEGELEAEWVPVSQNGGGVGGLAIDPGSKTIFAATTEGNNVFYSANGDGNWTILNLVPGIIQPTDLEFNPYDGSLWVTLGSPTAGTAGLMYRLPAVKTTNGITSYIKT